MLLKVHKIENTIHTTAYLQYDIVSTLRITDDVSTFCIVSVESTELVEAVKDIFGVIFKLICPSVYLVKETDRAVIYSLLEK